MYIIKYTHGTVDLVSVMPIKLKFKAHKELKIDMMTKW